jgi:hypothetical protein
MLRREAIACWDRWQVERWMPKPLRCLIIGENPGLHDFGVLLRADRPKRDLVRVRRELLDGLSGVGLITGPTLEAFRDAWFLSDHGNPMLPFIVNHERPKANRNDFHHGTAHRAAVLEAIFIGAWAVDAHYSYPGRSAGTVMLVTGSTFSCQPAADTADRKFAIT